MTTYALIDGDILVHHALPNRKNFHNKPEDWEGEYTLEEDEAYIHLGFNNVQRKIDAIKTTLFVDDALVAVKGNGNFRVDMYPHYKAHRANKPGGEIINEVRLRVIEAGLATTLDGYEADDQLRIWAETLREMGDDFIIVTIDKDLNMIGGQFYNPIKEITFEVSKRAAAFCYYQQLLMGDATDNIRGIPKIGPKKSEAILEHCVSHRDFKNAVEAQYLLAFGDKWMEELEMTGKLIYLSRFVGDQFNLGEWFEDRDESPI